MYEVIHHLLVSPNFRPKSMEVITEDQKANYRYSPCSNSPDSEKYTKSPTVDYKINSEWYSYETGRVKTPSV